MSAGAHLQNGYEPEERGSREAVIEHLQNDAVECGCLAGMCARIACSDRYGQRKDAEQAIAKMIN